TIYLRNRGWIYSVDLDAHSVAKRLKKKIHYLETIEEQVSALEAIPVEMIVRFISFFDRWEEFAKRHALYYKRGELDNMLKSTIEFPTRYKSIIEDRDPILFDRMKPYMEQGNAIAFVGTTHIKGLSAMFQSHGFNVSKVS
ncbi:MAG TPA: TraB/GumN family protein, partial [Syntrophorhabdaceae bacterium]|nr:TraB/GumN family protein [Syntrophorhabdaceae bacterium]